MFLLTWTVVSASAGRQASRRSQFPIISMAFPLRTHTTSDECTPLEMHMQLDAKKLCLHSTACVVEIMCEVFIHVSCNFRFRSGVCDNQNRKSYLTQLTSTSKLSPSAPLFAREIESCLTQSDASQVNPRRRTRGQTTHQLPVSEL